MSRCAERMWISHETKHCEDNQSWYENSLCGLSLFDNSQLTVDLKFSPLFKIKVKICAPRSWIKLQTKSHHNATFVVTSGTVCRYSAISDE